MAKRLGANSRKKQIERKGKIRKRFKKVFFRLFVTVLMGSALVVGAMAGKSGIGKIWNRFLESDYLSIKQIKVSGTVNVSREDIIAGSGLKCGDKLYKVKKKNITEILKKNPWIGQIKIERKLSGIILIRIKEREPVALVNDGNIRQIDRNGIVLPFIAGSVSSLPVITGLTIIKNGTDNYYQVVEDDLKRLLVVLNEVERSEKELLSGISQIDLTNKNLIRVKLQSLPTVIEMDTANISDRFAYLEALENMLCRDNAPERINLCYQNLAFVTDSK
ncbi:MAG TPA: FtsQ-type POTRA domain-containing protein [Chitinispirillaceae bacterium]|nr:FtsQ-type POTRA domain-containing protein [Chitinispirillaceae bacterium]